MELPVHFHLICVCNRRYVMNCRLYFHRKWQGPGVTNISIDAFQHIRWFSQQTELTVFFSAGYCICTSGLLFLQLTSINIPARASNTLIHHSAWEMLTQIIQIDPEAH